jgi:hypothetical protein
MMRDLATELTKNTYFLPIAHCDLYLDSYLQRQWGDIGKDRLACEDTPLRKTPVQGTDNCNPEWNPG